MLFYGLAFRLICQEFTDFLVLWSIGQGVDVLESAFYLLLVSDDADSSRYGFDGLLLCFFSNVGVVGIQNIAFIAKNGLDNCFGYTSFGTM